MSSNMDLSQIAAAGAGAAVAVSQKSRKRRRASTKTSSILPAKFSFGRNIQTPNVVVKLRYFDHYSLVLGALSQTFRLNSVYDPDYTNAGHQPYGFDQMAGLYSFYRVVRGSYIVTGANADLTSYAPSKAYVLVTDGGDPGGTMSNAAERGGPGVVKTIGAVTGSHGIQTWKGKFDVAKIAGIKRSELMGGDYGAVVSTNPVDIIWMWIYAASGAASESILFSVDLTFEVEFSSPTAFAQS